MHEILQHDKQQGRTMAWHQLTDVQPDLSLDNCWLNSWDYKINRIVIDGAKTSFGLLGVTDGAMVDGEDDAPGTPGIKAKVPLIIGDSFNVHSFKPVMNARLLSAVKEAIEGCGVILSSCGTVFNRGRTFLSFEMTNAKFTAANRPFVAFLNIGNGNNQSSPLWVNTSNTCTVCNNTFQVNMGTRGKIMEIKKTKFSDFKISSMSAAIEAMLAGQKEFAILLNRLASIGCTEEKARHFFAGFLGEENQPLSMKASNAIESLVAMFKDGKGNKGETWADVFQAGTDWYTHAAASTEDSAEAKWKNHVSSEFGSGANKKQALWESLKQADSRNLLIAMGVKTLELTAKVRAAEKLAKSAPVIVPAVTPAQDNQIAPAQS